MPRYAHALVHTAPHPDLISYARKLNLPESTQDWLIDTIHQLGPGYGPPPPGMTLVDCLRSRVYPCPGEAGRWFDKMEPLLNWALVFFPRQPIPVEHFWFWYCASLITESEKSKVCKEYSKLRRSINSLYLSGISLITSRHTSDPDSVIGFRLSADHDENVEATVERNNRGITRLVVRQLDAVDERRIDLDALKPENRRLVESERKGLRGNKKLLKYYLGTEDWQKMSRLPAGQVNSPKLTENSTSNPGEECKGEESDKPEAK